MGPRASPDGRKISSPPGFDPCADEIHPVAQSLYRLSYALDGPGSNPGGDEIFRPSRLALGPTQPPVKWVPGVSRR